LTCYDPPPARQMIANLRGPFISNDWPTPWRVHLRGGGFENYLTPFRASLPLRDDKQLYVRLHPSSMAKVARWSSGSPSFLPFGAEAVLLAWQDSHHLDPSTMQQSPPIASWRPTRSFISGVHQLTPASLLSSRAFPEGSSFGAVPRPHAYYICAPEITSPLLFFHFPLFGGTGQGRRSLRRP